MNLISTNVLRLNVEQKKGNRFGFCHFSFNDSSLELNLVDLTIADDISCEELNSKLEEYGQKQLKNGIKAAMALGYIPKYNVNVDEFKKLFTKWGVYTHTKLLSEQIFEPLNDTDDKTLMYAPFQSMAQYYICGKQENMSCLSLSERIVIPLNIGSVKR